MLPRQRRGRSRSAETGWRRYRYSTNHKDIETTCLGVCGSALISCIVSICTAMEVSVGNNLCARSVERLPAIYFFGAPSCLRSFGWGCIPGGESPSGLHAGAPPEVVLVGSGSPCG